MPNQRLSSPLLCFRVAPVLELLRNLSLGFASLQDNQAKGGEESAATDCVSGYFTLAQGVRC